MMQDVERYCDRCNCGRNLVKTPQGAKSKSVSAARRFANALSRMEFVNARSAASVTVCLTYVAGLRAVFFSARSCILILLNYETGTGDKWSKWLDMGDRDSIPCTNSIFGSVSVPILWS